MLKVAKFGGSSVAGADQFKKVKAIIQEDPARRIVIVSAAGKRSSSDHKLTDLLYLCHAHLTYGVPGDNILQLIQDRFAEIRSDLGLQYDVESDFAALRSRLSRDTTADELVSRGEYFTARLMAEYLDYDFVDAADCVFFGFDGQLDLEKTYAAIKEAAAKGRGIVIPGFYGSLPSGKIRVMSRGGSDISGALAAAAVDADVYENWTDVSGILMADPRIVKDPAPIEYITYSELRELAFMGASVLHEDSVQPVKEKGIPLNIRNTNDPEHPGTMIQDRFEVDVDPSRIITGITGKKDFSIITIFKRGLTSQVGILRRILSVLERHSISVDFVPNGIDNVSLVIPSSTIAPHLYGILADLQQQLEPDNITIQDQIAIVTAVGHRMAFRPGVSGRIFAALGQAGINIRMINQGPDELNIIFGVDNKDYTKAIQVLYNSFIK